MYITSEYFKINMKQGKEQQFHFVTTGEQNL